MANARRGEAAISFAGRNWRCCLTLGALAEIENHFGVDDLTALGEKLATGKLSARDLAAIFAAAARGGGENVTASDMAQLPADNLPALFEAVLQLFALAFPAEDTIPPNPQPPQRAASPSGPFPGLR